MTMFNISQSTDWQCVSSSTVQYYGTFRFGGSVSDSNSNICTLSELRWDQINIETIILLHREETGNLLRRVKKTSARAVEGPRMEEESLLIRKRQPPESANKLEGAQ